MLNAFDLIFQFLLCDIPSGLKKETIARISVDDRIIWRNAA